MSHYCNLQYFNHKNNTFVVSNMQYFQCGDFHGQLRPFSTNEGKFKATESDLLINYTSMYNVSPWRNVFFFQFGVKELDWSAQRPWLQPHRTPIWRAEAPTVSRTSVADIINALTDFRRSQVLPRQLDTDPAEYLSQQLLN